MTITIAEVHRRAEEARRRVAAAPVTDPRKVADLSLTWGS